MSETFAVEEENDFDITEETGLNTKKKQKIKKYPMRKMLFAYLLWAFLGIFGAHRFYLDDHPRGIMFFLTFGFFGIGWCIDGLLVPDLVIKCNTIRNELNKNERKK
eukprot:gene3976-7232_t